MRKAGQLHYETLAHMILLIQNPDTGNSTAFHNYGEEGEAGFLTQTVAMLKELSGGDASDSGVLSSPTLLAVADMKDGTSAAAAVNDFADVAHTVGVEPDVLAEFLAHLADTLAFAFAFGHAAPHSLTARTNATCWEHPKGCAETR